MGWIDRLAEALERPRPTITAPQGSPTREFAAQSLSRAIDWVKFADAKAGAVLAIVGLLLTNALSNAGVLIRAHETGGRFGDWATITFSTSIGLAVVTVGFVTLVLYPHVKPKTSSIAFFGQVAGLEVGSYLTSLRALSDSAATDEVAKQAWEVSRIAARKFRWLRLAYGAAVGFLALYSLSRLMLILNSPTPAAT